MGYFLSSLLLIYLEKKYFFLKFSRLSDNIKIEYGPKRIIINNWDLIFRGEALLLNNFFRKMPSNSITNLTSDKFHKITKGEYIYVLSKA